MATKTNLLRRLAAIAALLLCAAACKYPYDITLEDGEYPLVVDGDILIGAVTTIRFSYAQPLNQNQDLSFGYPYSSSSFIYISQTTNPVGYIEGEDGTRIEGTDPTGQPYSSILGMWSQLQFDTRGLRTDQRYRLVCSIDDGHKLESDWLEVCPAPVIDDLSYWKNDQFDELHIGLSMHCNGAHHFRWTYNEDWEYHSDLSASVVFEPRKGISVGGGDYYYCWSHTDAADIQIFSTENQIEDRFEELSFRRIDLTDRRLQMLYRMTLQLSALSPDAYNYWRTIRQNTQEQGSLFAPTPSEMASNVHCTNERDYLILGYLNAGAVATAQMYYDNDVEHFYIPPRGGYYKREDFEIDLKYDFMLAAYNSGWLPWHAVYGMGVEPTGYIWVRDVCIDCTKSGGSKNKPADWPNDHK